MRTRKIFTTDQREIAVNLVVIEPLSSLDSWETWIEDGGSDDDADGVTIDIPDIDLPAVDFVPVVSRLALWIGKVVGARLSR